MHADHYDEGNAQMQAMGRDYDAPAEEAFVEMQQPPSSRKRYFGKWGWKGSFRAPKFGLGIPNQGWRDDINQDGRQVTQALLSDEERENDNIIRNIGGEMGEQVNPSPLSSPSSSTSGPVSSSEESTNDSQRVPTPSWILPNGNGRQLSPLLHASLTLILWLLATVCAIKSPSLGDVLDLVGAFTGTLLAFILPSLFSFKLKGYNHLSMAILGIGGMVGLVGTIFSFIKFSRDIDS